jgi:O-antigen/teichoic acid export membrane protein
MITIYFLLSSQIKKYPKEKALSLLKQFSEDALVFGLGKGIKKFIGLLLLPIYTRALSPEEFGILDTLGAGIFFLTTLFGLGLDSASSYFFFSITR